MELVGNAKKMKTEPPKNDQEKVHYWMRLDEETFFLNEVIGSELHIEYLGEINCVSCGRDTKKSFSGGYCYPCSQSLAETDICVVKPELCHFAAGTCRDEAWGIANCMTPHTVYIANSSGIKVGITREKMPVRRWIDQGAVQAVSVCKVPTRLDSGKLEVALKEMFADKTNWRKMLKNEVEMHDLSSIRDEARVLLENRIPDFASDWSGEEPVTLSYPVERYPEKIKSFNLDKTPKVGGVLTGIKGQYLMFGDHVINVRKYSGYKLKLTCA